jgi:hypothetical protein
MGILPFILYTLFNFVSFLICKPTFVTWFISLVCMVRYYPLFSLLVVFIIVVFLGIV